MASTFSYTITAVDKVSAVVSNDSASIDKMTAPIRKVQQSVGRLNASLGQLARSTGLDKIGRGLWRLRAAATEAARRMMSMVPIRRHHWCRNCGRRCCLDAKLWQCGE